MLYYRLYKWFMHHIPGPRSAITLPFGDVLFKVVFPSIACIIAIDFMKRHSNVSQEVEGLTLFVFIGGAWLYIGVCKKLDKNRSA